LPASLVRLRIVGFKSFAEPTVVELLPGLTGIVGPNGCGKSNVVEALRWAMGENSARSLRGGEMDDVIFAGTAHRPRRDIAEVTLSLTDTEGLAPAPFHREPDLQISRRIERESGSVYRVNGREARARDVQTLFADLATGARSSAMVSQGRVAAVVGAAPAERRAILEEAAGITGLHARRHEAELKLRATEANLERAEDLRGQLAGQLEGLRRQAKQAARFRTIGDTIREAERDLLAIQQAAANRALAAAEAALLAAREAVVAAAASATATATEATEAAAAVPALRQTEAAARTALERARIEAEQAAGEAAEAERALQAARQRAAQVARDLDHARSQARDAAAAAERLAAEATRLAEEDAAHPAALAAAQRAATEATAALTAAEAEAEAATERSAEVLARHRAATEAHAAAATRARQTAARAGQIAEEVARARSQLVAPERLTEAEAARDAATRALQAAVAESEAADARRVAAQTALAAARAAASATEADRARLAAAAQGVAEALAANAGSGGPRVVDSLDVPPGLEAALAAALGEDLESATDPARPRHWRALPALDTMALPDGAVSLADRVGAPPELARALAHIGLIESDCVDRHADLQAGLRPGQTLVSREGGAWRWDGHTVRPGTPRATAVRLQQRNKLAALRAELTTAEAAASEARAGRVAAEAAERGAVAAEQSARAARRAAEQAIERARADHQTLAARQASAVARLATLEDQAARAEADQAEAAAALAAAAAALAALDDPDTARAAVDQTRAARVAARARDAATMSQLQALLRAAAIRGQRRASLTAERDDWAMRERDAAARVTDLTARGVEASADQARREAAPARATARREAAARAGTEAASAHRRAEAELAAGEARTAAAERAARAAESALAAAREAIVRAEAAVTTARHGWGTVAERVLERLGPSAELPEPREASAEAEERGRRRLERLQRERDDMGPVNLRAELEAAAIEDQVATIARETAELTTAIAKLRGSIGHINREGRERLGQVFADIDRHFRALFERMFGGGKAHLAMVGSDDPLLAGLEIYAQPPGKKLASLSLLSGGEQALAALSLIFAVFRCQPAPVCVLDEVDAPLDDANVGRFCALLEEMVRETGTRFLVVTHHQLTMARMDRLYGVTMQERGVSKVLSVDLRRAAEMVEPGRIAAE
jgi:chromosome segregation protein